MPNRRLGAPDQPLRPRMAHRISPGACNPRSASASRGSSHPPDGLRRRNFAKRVASSFALQGLMSELQPRIVGMMGQARLRAHCWLCMQSAMALPCAVAAACRGGRQRHG